MTEEVKQERTPFKLSDEELSNPKFRKGFPGRLYSPYPQSWDKNAPYPHSNYKPELSSYYKAGRHIGIRDSLTAALTAMLPPRKVRKNQEDTEE